MICQSLFKICNKVCTSLAVVVFMLGKIVIAEGELMPYRAV